MPDSLLRVMRLARLCWSSAHPNNEQSFQNELKLEDECVTLTANSFSSRSLSLDNLKILTR